MFGSLRQWVFYYNSVRRQLRVDFLLHQIRCLSIVLSDLFCKVPRSTQQKKRKKKRKIEVSFNKAKTKEKKKETSQIFLHWFVLFVCDITSCSSLAMCSMSCCTSCVILFLMKHTCVLLEFLLHVFFFFFNPFSSGASDHSCSSVHSTWFLDSFSSGKVTDTLSVWFLMRCNSQ